MNSLVERVQSGPRLEAMGAPDFTGPSKRKAIRVGFIGPSLLFGGAERWILTLARHCDPNDADLCLNVVTGQEVDPTMLGALKNEIPTFAQDALHFKGRSCPCSLLAALNDLKTMDVIVGWELDAKVIRSLGDHNHGLVNVLHRNEPSLSETIMPQHAVVAVSDAWHAILPARKESIDVIPNGVELDRCIPVTDRKKTRESWGANDTTIVVGTLGRIAIEKNHIALARGVAAMADDGLGLIFGSPTDRSNTILSSIRCTAGRKVRIFPPVEDIGSVFAALDVFCLPSHSEACPLSLLEALAARTPVVASSFRFAEELLGNSGDLVVPIIPDASGSEIAEAFYRAARTPATTLDRGRSVVFNEYGAKVMASRWTKKFMAAATRRAQLFTNTSTTVRPSIEKRR